MASFSKRWTEAQDTLITKYVCLCRGDIGKIVWSKIAAHIPGKNAKQCRQRWNEYLDPKLDRSKLSYSEKVKIVKMKNQNFRMCIMAKKLQRPPHVIKNFLYSKFYDEIELNLHERLKQNRKQQYHSEEEDDDEESSSSDSDSDIMIESDSEWKPQRTSHHSAKTVDDQSTIPVQKPSMTDQKIDESLTTHSLTNKSTTQSLTENSYLKEKLTECLKNRISNAQVQAQTKPGSVEAVSNNHRNVSHTYYPQTLDELYFNSFKYRNYVRDLFPSLYW